MKLTTRSILSATTGIGLTAFTLLSAFSANATTSVTATAFGLLTIYGVVEMMIFSYGPRRTVVPHLQLRVVSAPVVIPFPAESSRSCAA